MLNDKEHKPRIEWNRSNLQSKIPELTFDDEVQERYEPKNNNNNKTALLTNEIQID